MSTSSTVCNICQGSGWKAVTNGAAKSVTRCDCAFQARSERLLKQAKIPARYAGATLANFETEGSRELFSAKLAASNFLEHYPLEKRGLMYVGPRGVGKTHLAVSIIKELVAKKGIPCLFVHYRELLKEIQGSYNSDTRASEALILRPVLDTEILVLDELGAAKVSDWVWDTVSHVINSRYNEAKTTIITTNFDDKAAIKSDEPIDNLSKAKRVMTDDTLGDRITDIMLSRIHEMCTIVRVEASDYRQRELKRLH